MEKLWIPVLVSLSFVVILSCGGPKTDGAATKKPAHDTITTASGLKYFDIKPGIGAVPSPGQTVRVHCIGWLQDGKKFYSSRDLDDPIKFRIGAGQMIKGFDEVMMNMPVGTIRYVIIPPELGYGEKGNQRSQIPPNSTLIFEIELLEIVENPPSG
jgi:FKBP-type peptidyl-prolyl cis-trans isomerase